MLSQSIQLFLLQRCNLIDMTVRVVQSTSFAVTCAAQCWFVCHSASLFCVCVKNMKVTVCVCCFNLDLLDWQTETSKEPVYQLQDGYCKAITSVNAVRIRGGLTESNIQYTLLMLNMLNMQVVSSYCGSIYN
jgi:hypothetical protein